MGGGRDPGRFLNIAFMCVPVSPTTDSKGSSQGSPVVEKKRGAFLLH